MIVVRVIDSCHGVLIVKLALSLIDVMVVLRQVKDEGGNDTVYHVEAECHNLFVKVPKRTVYPCSNHMS